MEYNINPKLRLEDLEPLPVENIIRNNLNIIKPLPH